MYFRKVIFFLKLTNEVFLLKREALALDKFWNIRSQILVEISL